MNSQVVRPDPAAQIAGLTFPVLLLDPDDCIVDANPAAEDLLRQSASRLEGRTLGAVLAFEDQRVSDGLRGEGPVVATGIAVRAGTRDLRADLAVSPVPGHSGWRIVSLSDLRLGEVAEAKEDETGLRAPAILAHEIKNPLSAIRGASQLIERRVEGDERALAGLILKEVDRIASLVDRMQRLGSEIAEPVESFNLHEAVRGALAAIRAASAIADVQVDEEFDPSLPPILASRPALEQVILNLVTNAIEASGEEADARVTVRTRFSGGLAIKAKDGRNYSLPIELVVSDSGPGVPAELRDHLFEPFVSGKKNGQGLGLALVKKLVRDMNGRIVHERDEEKGITHFRVNLPVAS